MINFSYLSHLFYPDFTLAFSKTNCIASLQNIFDNCGDRGDLCFHSPICFPSNWTLHLPLLLWMYKSTLVSPRQQRLFTNSITAGKKNRGNLEKWTCSKSINKY